MRVELTYELWSLASSRRTDDVVALEELVKSEDVVLSMFVALPRWACSTHSPNIVFSRTCTAAPPQTDDDSYCVSYARQHDGFVVSNDMFRDQLERCADAQQRRTLAIWLQDRVIPYVGDAMVAPEMLRVTLC